MRSQILLCALVGATALAGCGSKNEVSEDILGAAVSKYLDQTGNLCLGVTSWPVDVTPGDIDLANRTPSAGPAGKMRALESLGLVSAVDTEVVREGWGGAVRRYQVRRYKLSDAAKPYIRSWEIASFNPDGGPQTRTLTDLCWSKRVLDKINGWEGPHRDTDFKVVVATYTYKLAQSAAWANDAKIQAAFVGIKIAMDGAGKKQDFVSLNWTADGWKAQGTN